MANTQKNNPKDGLALVIGGIFILSLVFATYNYFNKGDDRDGMKDINGESVFQDIKEEGDLNGEGMSTELGSVSGLGTGGPITSYVEWQANDYSQGDISGNSYTVIAGDTLWEIAEAVYGNGGDWVKILDANSNTIGFLPNGQQSLIVPGQVLVLP